MPSTGNTGKKSHSWADVLDWNEAMSIIRNLLDDGGGYRDGKDDELLRGMNAYDFDLILQAYHSMHEGKPVLFSMRVFIHILYRLCSYGYTPSSETNLSSKILIKTL